LPQLPQNFAGSKTTALQLLQATCLAEESGSFSPHWRQKLSNGLASTPHEKHDRPDASDIPAGRKETAGGRIDRMGMGWVAS
jgi:hypothetical protein